MSGENNKIKQSEVIESIDTIKQYMKEHDLKSPAFTGHNEVFLVRVRVLYETLPRKRECIMEVLLMTTLVLGLLERINENAGWVCIANCGVIS